MNRGILMLPFNRSTDEPSRRPGAVRHARLDGSQHAREHGPAARLRHRPAHRAGAAGALALNQGTIYPALLRLEQKGWIKSAWGTSENNRRARFYSITASGRRQLASETELWARTVSIVNRLLEGES